MKPLCIDLFCGLGGWSQGFLAEGYEVVGFDIELHVYGGERYPAQLVIQDVLTLYGSQFSSAACLVASPPCQAYSYMAMPWQRAKREIRWQKWNKVSPFSPEGWHLNDLFDACFRIQREASEAAGHHIPMVVENVKGAQTWVGRAAWHYGSYYLWGDVPAVMPFTTHRKLPNHDTFHRNGSPVGRMTERRYPSQNGDEHRKRGVKGAGSASWFFGTRADPRDMRRNEDGEYTRMGMKNDGDAGIGEGLKVPGIKLSEVGFNPFERDEQAGVKIRAPGNYRKPGSGPDWFDGGPASKSSRSDARKAASAQIAKIPFELASWIARCYYPLARVRPMATRGV